MTRIIQKATILAAFVACATFSPFAMAASRNADGTYSETVGSNANTWTNYTNAGGNQGPTIPSDATVEIACVVQGFRVADGNTSWYLIASSPWNSAFYVSADAFYNNGQTSGSLIGTPWVDPAVPSCNADVSGVAETTGSEANTWTDYADAGGSQGQTIGDHATVIISCRLIGFTVQDGNPWWYRIASPPWGESYYVSADPFYNNGQISGDLVGTPFFDPAVPLCGGSPGSGTDGEGASGGGSQGASGSSSAPVSTGSSGAAPLSSSAPPTPNAFYNRNLAVSWALRHAEDTQRWGDMCTWFVSQALWAGGFPQSSPWRAAGSFKYDLIQSLPGTPDAWQLLSFLPFFESHFAYSLTPITADFKTNMVPQAEPGDLIIYNWKGSSIKDAEHVAMVTGLVSGHYPEVSEWGQLDRWFDPVIRKIVADHATYEKRGWTWYATAHKWIQKEFPDAHAWLLHIDGGVDTATF